jgi:hypothetical protein
MNLPKNSIAGYQDFHRKLIHQFAGSKHVQVTATNMFSLRQRSSETLREYLARFSEATIKVSNPNQEMFVAAFHNGLRAGHFNESLAQKPAETMQEVMKRAECYIKGEESNAEKRSRITKKEPQNQEAAGTQNTKGDAGQIKTIEPRGTTEAPSTLREGRPSLSRNMRHSIGPESTSSMKFCRRD